MVETPRGSVPLESLQRLERQGGQILDLIREIDRRVAVVEERTRHMAADIAERVTKTELAPLKALVFGAAGIMLTAVLTALIAAVRLKPGLGL